jgi:hypothetical protein
MFSCLCVYKSSFKQCYVTDVVYMYEVIFITDFFLTKHILHRVIKVSVHLMIKVQKFASNVQSVPRQSPDIQ